MPSLAAVSKAFLSQTVLHERAQSPEMDALLERIESVGVTIAQGVYGLIPEQHTQLLEEATTFLQVRARGFACVTIPTDQVLAPFYLVPEIESQRRKLDWLEE